MPKNGILLLKDLEMIENKHNIAFSFLILYISWSWIFIHSVLASSIPILLSLLLLLYLYGKHTIFHIVQRLDFSIIICLPFTAFMIFSYFYQLNIEAMIYWFITMSIIITAPQTGMIDMFPYKLTLATGIIATMGVLVQWLLPDFYDQFISPFIVYEMLDSWIEAEIGLNGITYQLGFTARLIILGLMVLLFTNGQSTFLMRHRIIKLAILIAMIIAILLTSKRMNAFIALLILTIYYALYNNHKTIKTYIYFGLFIIVIGIGVNYLISNADHLLDSKLFGRLASMTIDINNGDQVATSGRDVLWAKAIEMYNENPIFGIGISNFKQSTGVSVHNAYLQMLCEGGIFGITIMMLPILWYLIATINRCYNDKRTRYYPYLLFSLVCQLNFIIEGITDNTIENTTGFIIYAFSISIFVDYKRKYQQITNNRKLVYIKSHYIR